MNIDEMKQVLHEQVLRLESGYSYASAFVEKVKSKNAYVGTYEKFAGVTPEKCGVTLTVFNGHYFKEYSTDNISKGHLTELTERILTDSKNDKLNSEKALNISSDEKITQDFATECLEPVENVSLNDLLVLGKKQERDIFSKNKSIVNVGISFNLSELEEIFVNRYKVLSQKITRTQSVFEINFQDGQNASQIWGGNCFVGGAEHLVINDKEVDTAVQTGHKLLYAQRLTPGIYDCIFSPSMAGMFAHEAFGHGMETDMFLKKRAKGEQYLNRQVASSLVDMYDSPALNGAAGSYFFDHEGEIATTTQIIKSGKLISGLTDFNSALRLGLKRTPNGRRQAYDHKVYARMTNTYFGTGTFTLEEMIHSVKSGYYIDYATNGMEDPKGWGIQLEALMAREIINGQLTDNYFTPVIVTGYVPDLLMSVSMVGKDSKLNSLGMCGKGNKEWVRVTDGGPALKLKARLA